METGGIETMLVNIINEQVKTQKVSLIVINDFVEKDILANLSPRCDLKLLCRKPGSKNPWNIIKLNVCLQKISPDIIHVHSSDVSKIIIGKWNIVRTIHNTRNKTEEYPKMSALYAISEAVKDDAHNMGFDNVTIVENGIKASDFNNYPINKKGKDYFHILQLGRLFIKQKGQDGLINALDILVKSRKYKNIIVHFIGDGPDRDKLNSMAVEKGLSQHIVFEGTKTQEYLHENLCTYDLFIQPSNYEGFGLTVAEAMAARLPVLVSDIEGPMEIIDGGRCGMCFRCGDAKDLADKIEDIMKNGYDQSMIEMAHDRVCKLYDVRNTANRYIEEYKKVLKK